MKEADSPEDDAFIEAFRDAARTCTELKEALSKAIAMLESVSDANNAKDTDRGCSQPTEEQVCRGWQTKERCRYDVTSGINENLHDTRLDAIPANRRLVDNGICICIEITPKYTSSIILYDRTSPKNCDTYYYVSDSVLDGLVERIRGLFSCILGIDEVTMSVNWKRRAGEYQCAKRDPGVAHLFSEGRIDFEVRVLQSIEKKHFNSFEFIISGSEMRLLLYKNGHYAFKGLPPSTPLSSFGIDQDRLLAVSNELIEFCNPGESVLFQNEIENVDSQINNSGCVYFVEKYILESNIA